VAHLIYVCIKLAGLLQNKKTGAKMNTEFILICAIENNLKINN